MEQMRQKIPLNLTRPEAMLLAWYLATVGLIPQAQHILDLYPEPEVMSPFWTITPWGFVYTGP